MGWNLGTCQLNYFILRSRISTIIGSIKIDPQFWFIKIWNACSQKREFFYEPIGRGYLLFLVQLCTHTLVCKARRMDDFLKKKKNLKSVKLNWIQWHRFDSFKVGWDRISEPNCLRIEVLMIIEPLLSRRFIDAFVVSEWVNKDCTAQKKRSLLIKHCRPKQVHLNHFKGRKKAICLWELLEIIVALHHIFIILSEKIEK